MLTESSPQGTAAIAAIRSPLTGSHNVLLESEVETALLAARYQRELGLYVGDYFRNRPRIQLYRCLDTGYRFFYPFDLSGTEAFYEALQQFSWYYEAWKWEHEVARGLLDPGDHVLEIGCGPGSFLAGVQARGMTSTGLELNPSAVKAGSSRGLEILRESIEAHAARGGRTYDAVCSFQVLEHISAVGEFLRASISMLKPGGLLVLSVPDNTFSNLFLENAVLDMPPHHMGLWGAGALTALQPHFGLQLKGLMREPAQRRHLLGYRKIIRDNLVQQFGWAGKLFYLANRFTVTKVLGYLSAYLQAHSVLAWYTKQ